MDVELHQLELRYAALRRRSAARERSLLASLAEAGQQAPVVVVSAGLEAGRWVLLDGYKRVRALGRLGRDTVRATCWDLPEEEALLLERLMRSREADSALEEGWLLRELQERFGLSCEELARRFDKSKSWVSRRLALVSALPEAVQDCVRKGELVAHAAMRHLVPLARANASGCTLLAAALAGQRLSARQVGTLCRQWVRGGQAARELILQSPQLALRAQEALQRKGPGQRLAGDVRALAAIAQRAATTLEEAGAALCVTEAGPQLKRGLTAAQEATGLLFTRLEEALARA